MISPAYLVAKKRLKKKKRIRVLKVDSFSLNNGALKIDFSDLKDQVLDQINQQLREVGSDFLTPFLFIDGQVVSVAFNGQDEKYVIDLDPDAFKVRDLFQKTVDLFKSNHLAGAAAFPLDQDQLLVIFYQDEVFAALAGQSQGRTLTTRDFQEKELRLLSE